MTKKETDQQKLILENLFKPAKNIFVFLKHDLDDKIRFRILVIKC